MPNLMPLPFFADAGAVVALLVFIFTVVGWLVNMANSQNNPPVPPPNRPRPPRPKGERVQNEIDIFLQEVRGQNVPPEDVVLEALPPEEPRHRVRPASSPLETPPEPARPLTRGRLGSASRAGESHVGETLSSHHLGTHVGETGGSSEQPDPRTMGEMVALQKLGSQSGLPMLHLFQDQQSIRQAILVNEILSKPKSMRDG